MSEEKDEYQGRTEEGTKVNSNEAKIIDKIEEDDVYIRKLLGSIEDGVLEDRVAHELYTYARRAKFYKWFYTVCFGISISIPAVAAALQFMDGTVWKVIVVMLMGSVTISTGLIKGLKVREKWEHYRCHCETAKHEIFCCLMGLTPYDRDKAEREKLLAERLEEMIVNETGEWRVIRPQLQTENVQISGGQAQAENAQTAQINNRQAQLDNSDKTGR